MLARLVLALSVLTGGQLLLTTAAAADPPALDWHRLRTCESSDNYAADTGNGYFGAYQFDLPTWRSVGGTGQPNLNPPGEQDYRALYLYRMRGFQPWECALRLGLQDDADARSQRAPRRGDADYMSGATHTRPAHTSTPPARPGARPATPGPHTAPPWPGVVYARGDCAPALREFQLQMNTMGYHLDGTGCYFDKTQQAVLDLQRANGIRDSGRIGPKTWQAAWAGVHPHP